MDSILNWYTEEGVIFKVVGAGVNLSKIRSSHELLKGGARRRAPSLHARCRPSAAPSSRW